MTRFHVAENKALMEVLGITQKNVLEFTVSAKPGKPPLLELVTPILLNGRLVNKDGEIARNVQRFFLTPIDPPAAPAGHTTEGFDLARMVAEALARLEAALENDVLQHRLEMRHVRWRQS